MLDLSVRPATAADRAAVERLWLMFRHDMSDWRRVATAVAGDAWNEERRPVPNRPDLPPDVWISFGTTARWRRTAPPPPGTGPHAATAPGRTRRAGW